MNQTDNYPDLSNYGYQITQQLGKNQATGCITWQGIIIKNKTPVVIKQFRFATKDSSWTGYQTYQQEIELLKTLNNPGIPKYLADFETENSFYFVREYLEGISLVEQKEINEKKLKVIAVKTLDILNYLQQQQPPILYLNLTPNNILVDNQLNVYLIDFSLARKISSQVKSTDFKLDNAEFIAPEQFKQPTQASDIYSLGQTLIKVINQQQSLALIDSKDISFSNLDNGFQDWLSTMTETDLTKRYSDAENALNALKKSCWDDIYLVATSDKMTLSPQKFCLGIAGMTSLGFAIALGFKVSQQVTEKSFVNMTIALMGVVIIYLTQLASATIITNDNREQKQAISVAISVPIILAIITGIIFGKGEAVAMSLSAIIAQTATLGYVLAQKLPFSQPENTIKGIALVIAITLGLICGIIIF